ncbi:MAG: type II toxin-antitoxin system HicA family toxin [Opitutaceae bacterium]|jgi:predicted RNA binding protein YcfA (HicA-like mRNA interferase family)|nr:type II toxin-antitoxin system HicA family toxin [Opitutaceae bacterium]
MKCWRDETAARCIRPGTGRRVARAPGYAPTRQKGSHIRVTTQQESGHHEVVPARNPIKTGTLSSILKSVAAHHGVDVGEVIRKIGL